MSDLDWMGDGPASDEPMLDVDALNARVKKAAKGGNIPEIRRLLEQADGYAYTLGVRDQIVAALMHGDFDYVLQATVEPATIEHWCMINAHVLVKKCPTLFERWARPIPRYVHAVAAAHADLNAEAKNAMLATPATPQQKFLHAALRKHPHLWKELSPSWVGAKGSVLRETARGMGWDESRLPAMVLCARGRIAKEGCPQLAYPYSILALSSVLLTTPLARFLISSTSIVQAPCDANPRDIALAQAVLEKTERWDCAVAGHADMPSIDERERMRIAQMVDMHVMLGSLGALLDSLVHDVLPGVDAPTPRVLAEQELRDVDFGGMA